MSNPSTQFRLVIASPSDVNEERDAIEMIVDKLNEEFKNDYVYFSSYRWEKDSVPMFSKIGVQAELDQILNIKASDVFIGIFFQKAGTPVFDSISGTHHELKQAISSWEEKGLPEIKLYFKNSSVVLNDLDVQQLEDVIKIRKLKSEMQRFGITQDFSDLEHFTELVEKHLRLFLKGKCSKLLIEDSFNKNSQDDIVKLIEIYRQEEKLIDYKSEKDQIEKVELLKNRIYSEIFKSFEEKKAAYKNVRSEISKILFNTILVQEFIDNDILTQLHDVRYNTERFKFYDRSLIVSSLTLSLITHSSFDPKKMHVLIDYLLDFEEEVWQRALTGLTLALIKNQNKLTRYNELVNRLKLLHKHKRVQSDLLLIETLLRDRLYLKAFFVKNIFEYDFFKKDISNCFLPFYQEHPSVLALSENAKFDFDIDEIVSFLEKAPLLNSIKYGILLSKNLGLEKNKDENPKYEQLLFWKNRLEIAEYFSPYHARISEFYYFFKHFPQYSFEELFAKRLFLSKLKVKNLIFSKIQVLHITANAHYAEQEFNSAIPIYKSILNIDPADLKALWGLADSYSNIHDHDKALTYLLQFSSLTKDVNALRAIANCYRHKGDFENELKYLKEAEELHNDNIYLIIDFADYYLRICNILECERYFALGFKLQPKSRSLQLSYCHLKYYFYEDKTFVRDYLSKEVTNTNDLDTLEFYAATLMDDDEFEEANKVYKKILSIDRSAEYKAAYGLLLVVSDINKLEGQSLLEKSIKSHPYSPSILFDYLRYLITANKDELEILRVKEVILQKFPRRAHLLQLIGSYLVESNPKNEEGLEILYKAEKIDPFSSNTLSLIGVTLCRLERYDESEIYLKKAYELRPYISNGLVNYVSILLINSKIAEADELIKSFYSKRYNPSDELKLVVQFLVYAHFHDKLEESEEYLKKYLSEGIRSKDSILELNINAGIKQGHPHPEQLRKYALQIQGNS